MHWIGTFYLVMTYWRHLGSTMRLMCIFLYRSSGTRVYVSLILRLKYVFISAITES